MRAEDFAPSAPGRVRMEEFTTAGRRITLPAFFPNPLPAILELTPKTVVVISEAAEALGRLDSAISRLPNPNLLTRASLRREAQSTAALEGTHVSLEELMISEVDSDAKPPAQVLEVGNYLTAVELATTLLKSKPLVFPVIDQLQKAIVAGTPDDYYDAGQIRQRQVYIGGSADDPDSIRFIPLPPGDDLVRATTEWEKWIHTEHDIPTIAKVALAHYQFETIHPYSNGNGRVGRLIIVLQLMTSGVLTYPVLTLSQWLEKNKEQYRDLLLHVSQTGDFESWVNFFSRGLRASARADLERIDGLLALQKKHIDVVKDSGDRTEARNIVSTLIAYPMVSVGLIAKQHGITIKTATAAIRKLESLGLINEITGKSYARKWVAQDVLKFLNS